MHLIRSSKTNHPLSKTPPSQANMPVGNLALSKSCSHVFTLDS
eukprot:Gb_39643 [translate_table: standard]